MDGSRFRLTVLIVAVASAVVIWRIGVPGAIVGAGLWASVFVAFGVAILLGRRPPSN